MAPTSFSDVSKLYDSIATSEWERLDLHPMEREITLKIIQQYVTGNKIVDIGGGPGKIALALADKGYDVDLLDISSASIALAKEMDKQHKLKSAAVGNAIDLDLKPEYDGVLLLGPLYHLMEENERTKAVENAIRAAKPGGHIFCAMITIDAHLRDIAIRDPGRLVTQKDFYSKYLRDGWYERPGVQSFHTRLAWVQPFFKSFHDVELIRTLPAEGILSGGLDENLGDNAWIWADLMLDFVTEEHHCGCADHIIIVLKKKGPELLN